MNEIKWINKNTKSLKGKTIAISGSTGGIGQELCKWLCYLGANLILLDRNLKKSEDLKNRLLNNFKDINIQLIKMNLEDIESVITAAYTLKKIPFDALILNAGAYSIPRKKCSTGLDNVFQINFASPYFLIREVMPDLLERGGKIVVVGSIAHNYSKTDINDIDFSFRKKASLVYGNAKRYLMYSLFELFNNRKGLAVTHPGITFTNITAHYPKYIFAIIKYPMKVIFMKPSKASLCILKGLFEDTCKNEWIGPNFFNVWGFPKKQKLKTCYEEESKIIFKNAEKIYYDIKNSRQSQN